MSRMPPSVMRPSTPRCFRRRNLISPPIESNLFRIASITITSPGPAISNAAYSGDSSPAGFSTSASGSCWHKPNSDRTSDKSQTGVHRPEIRHVRVACVVAVTRQHVDNRRRVHFRQSDASRLVKDVVRCLLDDRQLLAPCYSISTDATIRVLGAHVAPEVDQRPILPITGFSSSPALYRSPTPRALRTAG